MKLSRLRIRNFRCYKDEIAFDFDDMAANGEKFKIAGFGDFEVKQKADRHGRNPQTGEAITIEARRILTFKPSGVLRDAINKLP